MNNPFSECKVGLATQWRIRAEYGYVGPQPYVAALQEWHVFFLRWHIWTYYITVGEIPIWQYCAYACLGEPMLTPEQRERFTNATQPPPPRTDHDLFVLRTLELVCLLFVILLLVLWTMS